MPVTRSKRRFGKFIDNGNEMREELKKTPKQRKLKTELDFQASQSLQSRVDETPVSHDFASKTRKPAARRLEVFQKEEIENASPSVVSKRDEENGMQDNAMSWSDSSDDDESREKINKRMAAIKEKKQALIKQLAIVEMKNELNSYAKVKPAPLKQSNPCFVKPPQPKVPCRKSLRLLRKDPLGLDLPPEPVEFVEENPRKPGTEFPMVACGFDEESKESTWVSPAREEKHKRSVADYADFMQKLPEDLYLPDIFEYGTESKDLKSCLERFKRLKIAPDQVQKVVKDRIFSLAIHPTHEKILVAAGDKSGNLGLWDVMRNDSNGGAYQFSPHISPISCLKYSPTSDNKLFMCSYDGQLRCMDLDKLVFEEAIVDDEATEMSGFDFLNSDKCLVTSRADGCVDVIDVRMENSSRQSTFIAHKRAAKCVSVNPTQRDYIATSFRDGSVMIFDLRKVNYGNKPSTPVVSLHGHSRSVSSAYFSPITGNCLLTTSYDDRLRLFDTSVITSDAVELVASCHHNNHTGRWLSSFRACWHPQLDDVFVVGCMKRPRQIEIFDSNASPVHVLCEPEVLTSVCSINCFHPTNNILAGGNSSGRVFVFSQ